MTRFTFVHGMALNCFLFISAIPGPRKMQNLIDSGDGLCKHSREKLAFGELFPRASEERIATTSRAVGVDQNMSGDPRGDSYTMTHPAFKVCCLLTARPKCFLRPFGSESGG